jgi:hypothetical protein
MHKKHQKRGVLFNGLTIIPLQLHMYVGVGIEVDEFCEALFTP